MCSSRRIVTLLHDYTVRKSMYLFGLSDVAPAQPRVRRSASTARSARPDPTHAPAANATKHPISEQDWDDLTGQYPALRERAASRIPRCICHGWKVWASDRHRWAQSQHSCQEVQSSPVWMRGVWIGAATAL